VTEGDALSLGEKINIGILIATAIAIIAGPIVAVLITRKSDRERENRQRRLQIYRTLMETRGARLAPDHVRALNAIPVEFFFEETVLQNLRIYIQHLSSPLPAADQQDRFGRARNDIFLDLLFSIGNVLGYRFDRAELERLSYMPTQLVNDEERIRRVQGLLLEVFEGRRGFPVIQFVPPGTQSLFPPAPD